MGIRIYKVAQNIKRHQFILFIWGFEHQVKDFVKEKTFNVFFGFHKFVSGQLRKIFYCKSPVFLERWIKELIKLIQLQNLSFCFIISLRCKLKEFFVAIVIVLIVNFFVVQNCLLKRSNSVKQCLSGVRLQCLIALLFVFLPIFQDFLTFFLNLI